MKNRKQLISRLYQTLCSESKRRHNLKSCYIWRNHARPAQIEPSGNWSTWLIMAGRGFGKTRTGAETIRSWVSSGRAKHICLLGGTIDEVLKVMVMGESGLLSVTPPSEKPRFERSKGQLIWPNGAVATFYSAHNPEKLRGPQFDAAWIDELAKFPDPKAVWDQLRLCLRLGTHPRTIITTTPKPHPLLFKLVQQQNVFVTRGQSFENAAHLSQEYIKDLHDHYLGTALGAQEIEGQLLDIKPSALWSLSLIEKARISKSNAPLPELIRVVISVDPAVTGTQQSDETGIIVAGCDAQGYAYILEDLSAQMSPSEWADTAVRAYHTYQADVVVAEVNNGGDLVENLIRGCDRHVSYRAVRATRGKVIRAEPVAALYQRGRVFHKKIFSQLEEQMLSFTPESGRVNSSPDRVDALVWAVTELLLSASSKVSSNTSGSNVWRV
jgi:predicted phage terminase large subunit-like protein